MRFLTFRVGGRTSWGVAVDAGVVDLGARRGASLRCALQHGGLEDAAEQAAGLAADHSMRDIEFLPPIDAPEKICCIGVNYAERNAEYKDGSQGPKRPSVFMRTVDSLIGHGQNLWRPPESHQLDYEGEIALIIGRPGHRIAEDRALEHIAGVTLVNEGTVRDWVRHAKFNVTPGKNFVRSGSVGPWMVSADEFRDYGALSLTTRVNGAARQQDTTANLIFPFPYLISYLSTFFVLRPGDIISTGTPPGAGARLDPPQYLQPGDTIDVEVPGIGTLSNGVEDDPTVGAAP